MVGLVAGDFGIIHQGHIDHIIKAYMLADWLIIATHPDEGIKERKGYIPIPLWARMMILKGLLNILGGQGQVVLAKDKDGGCVKTLRHYRPTFFIKGGEYNKDNLPKNEIEVCEELGIQIIYGVGERLSESRKLVKEL